MRYDGVDDETRIGNHVLGDVGLVDWCATKRQESGVGRGWDWELTAWRNDWRSFLVVLITPAQKHEPTCLRCTTCGVCSPFLLAQRQAEKPGNDQIGQRSHHSLTKRRERIVTRRVGSVVDSITKTKMTAGRKLLLPRRTDSLIRLLLLTQTHAALIRYRVHNGREIITEDSTHNTVAPKLYIQAYNPINTNPFPMQ